MAAIVGALERISRWCGSLAALLVLLLIFLMVYEVFVRYVLGAPTTWGYEIGTWVMAGTFLLAIAYALQSNAHVRIDLLHTMLPQRTQPIVDLVGYLLLLPLLAWVAWGLWEYFWVPFVTRERSGQSAWNPVIWPFRLILLAGVLAWTLQVIAEIIKCAVRLSGRAPSPDARAD